VWSNAFYRNPRLTALFLGLVIVAGLAALQSLARQEDPTLARRFGSVRTVFPGASALRVESLVTDKLEKELLELHEIREIQSESRTGISVLRLELDEQYEEEDVDEIWSKVRDRIDQARREFPPGVGAPDFEDQTSTAITLLVGFTWDREGPPQLGLMTRLAEELENRLRNVPGTKETDLHGEAEEEIRISVAPDVLAGVGLTAAAVSDALARADSKVPAGQLRNERNDLLIEVAGELDSLARIRDVPLRDAPGGQLLRVGDVALVERAVREPAATEAWLGGRRGVAVSATMQSDRRVDLWADDVHAVVEEFGRLVPEGVGYRVIFDQSVYTQERLGTLVGNLLLGATIVVLILFLLMGLRSALIVGSALPITVCMVLAELNFLGVPLHQTSVTGIIIALGLLIDNAIVVVDEYNLRVRRGVTRPEAVSATVRHLFVPLAASTLTTILAFLPIVLMPGGAGEFVGPISIGVGLAVGSSFLVSMTVIPAVAAFLTSQRTLERAREGRRGAFWKDGFSSPRLAAAWSSTLDFLLARPGLGIAISLVLPVAGFVAANTLTEQFFPPNDRNQFQIQLVLPSQTSTAETRRNALRARALLHAHDEVVESHWFVGDAAPRVFYTMIQNEEGVSSYAGAFVTTRSPDATERLLPRLQRELLEAFPNARVMALPFEQGPPFDAPIEVRILGPDLDELRHLGEQVRAVLAETNDVTYTVAKIAGGEPKLMVRADEIEARIAGLRLAEVADQLHARLEGAEGGSLLERTEELPVRVRVLGEHRADLRAIAAGNVLGADAAADARGVAGVPLAAMSEIDLVPELSGVTRRNGERSNSVQAFLLPYTLIAESLADFRRRLDASGFTLPEGYRLEFGGESEERSEALANLMAFALPLFVIMAGTIILSFNSFRLAGIIGAVAFLSVGLAMLGVWSFGYPMGFLAIIGTMGLVGLAINDSIVVLNALQGDAGARAGELEDTREVVVEATRHIVATTFTTIGGFTPLILFGGRFWPPLATAIAGGVLGASILALIFVPCVFVRSRRRDQRRAAKRAARRARGKTPRPQALGEPAPRTG